ncbi:MAG: IPExxxVDY family protein [Bacteroidales bacterium]|nr:IPExxxVDY family protein [Bacteroidales bacterium]MDE7072518.1 IPExxxVDY family protein [Bacteroidales bacterium]
MQKFTLDTEASSVDLHEISVIALHAGGMPSYKLVHFLNKHLGWKLRHTRMRHKPPFNPKMELDVFTHVMNAERVQWFLVNNKKDGHVWIPKLDGVDYWLLFFGAGALFFDMEQFLQQISELDFIINATYFPLEKAQKPEQKSPFFKFFQALYQEADEKNMVRWFE